MDLNTQILDIREISLIDTMMIFFPHINYGAYYGDVTNDGQCILYHDLFSCSFVGVKIFNFWQIIEEKYEIDGMTIEYSDNTDTLKIKRKFRNICIAQPYDKFTILYDDADVVGIEIFDFKKQIRSFR